MGSGKSNQIPEAGGAAESRPFWSRLKERVITNRDPFMK
jgi:hypothetical protein